jgi:4-amino-4-deoxy-L-arabinose transferase-like glycosyltransferase
MSSSPLTAIKKLWQRPRPSERLVDRVARWVAVAASIWFALAAAWGMFGPVLAGHYGTMGSEGVIGENIVRWHILGPVWNYVKTAPTPDMYYCHHPWGGFWVMGIVSAIFGHHNFILPLPAVLMSAAMPPLLYGIASDAWGKVPGAAAAVGFAVVPITLGFANFHNLEVMLMFSCAVFFWGHARMLATWKRRYLLVSLLGVLLAASSDWMAYLIMATLLGWSLLRAHILPSSWTPALSHRRYSTWWALSVTLSLAMLALWIGLFAHSDKLLDWINAGSSRGGGRTSLAEALTRRQAWIEISFTPLVIFLGKLAAPVALLRLLTRRRDEEVYSLAFLVGATTTYVVFQQGADVHIFWPQYFGAYFALALAQLVATLGDAIEIGQRGIGSAKAIRLLRTAPLALTVLFGLIMLPDALRTLRYARETGGRFNQNGYAMTSESNIVEVLWRLKKRLPSFTGPDVMSPQMAWSWVYSWASEGQGRDVASMPTTQVPPDDPHPIFMTRAGGLSLEQQKKMASSFRLDIYDDEVWVADRRQPPAPLTAYAFEEREPHFWEWYFISGVEPVRKYVVDPYKTWEWRTHLDQPAERPAVAPKTLEQTRIAHNIAVAAGNTALAASLRSQIETELDRSCATQFTQGLSLLGFQRIRGVEPRIVLFFHAATAMAGDVTFAVRAAVEARKFLSLIPPDPTQREVAVPAPMLTKAYRPGFIYAQTVVLRQRVGVERFWGLFQSKDGSAPPVRIDGKPITELLVLR